MRNKIVETGVHWIGVGCNLDTKVSLGHKKYLVHTKSGKQFPKEILFGLEKQIYWGCSEFLREDIISEKIKLRRIKNAEEGSTFPITLIMYSTIADCNNKNNMCINGTAINLRNLLKENGIDVKQNEIYPLTYPIPPDSEDNIPPIDEIYREFENPILSFQPNFP